MKSLSREGSTYLRMLRWEQILAISFISSSSASIVLASLFATHLVVFVALTLIVIGTGLSFLFRRFIRSDYLHADGVWLILGILPPFSISLMFFGMVQTWMQRVGFGMAMRVSVVSLLVTLLVSLTLSANTVMALIVFSIALPSALLRERAPFGWYLFPAGLALMIRMLVAW